MTQAFLALAHLYVNQSTPSPIRGNLEEPVYDSRIAECLINRALTELPAAIRNAEGSLSGWISSLLDTEKTGMRTLESFGFRKFEFYFPSSVLLETMVAVVPQCPELPLKVLGLGELDMPSGVNARGITFRNAYFVAAGSELSERLHFHEAVHTIQWKILGESGFLLTYGAGLLKGGYAGNPLEIMAYELDARFSAGGQPFDVVREVRIGLGQLAGFDTR